MLLWDCCRSATIATVVTRWAHTTHMVSVTMHAASVLMDTMPLQLPTGVIIDGDGRTAYAAWLLLR